MIFLSTDIHKTSNTIPCTEKGSEYCTYNECEDVVNHKGRLTESQEAKFFYKTSCAITCIECKKLLFSRKKQETSCD